MFIKKKKIKKLMQLIFWGRTLRQCKPNLNLIVAYHYLFLVNVEANWHCVCVSAFNHCQTSWLNAIEHFILPLFLVFTMLCRPVTDFVYCRMAMAFGLFRQNLAPMFFGPCLSWLHLCFSLDAPSFAPTHTISHKYSSQYSRFLKMTNDGMFVCRNSDW